jgi:hypothetical protein
MASAINNDNAQSLSLDLENLIQQYNSVLNFFNAVQAELTTYVNTPYPVNPYVNTNIQFTTGQICYVTKNGVVKLYQDADAAYSLVDDQNAVNQTTASVSNENNAISQVRGQMQSILQKLGGAANKDINSVINAGNNTASAFENAFKEGFNISNFFKKAEQTVENVGKTVVSDVENVAKTVASDVETAVTDAEEYVTDIGTLAADKSVLSSLQSTLNSQETTLASDTATLAKNSCPPLTQVTQVNLPWLLEYNNPGVIIPTTPQLVTGTPMTGTSVSQGLSCNAINFGNPPPPIDLILVASNIYSGGSPIGQVTATDAQACSTFCYTTPSCTGATFNSENNMCSLSSGEGSLMSSTSNNTAIVPQLIQYLDVMIALNARLTNINNRILQVTNQAEPVYNNLNEERYKKKKELEQSYNNLVQERDKVEQLVNEYETLQDDETYNNLTTNSNYLSFVLLFLLGILVIVILTNIGATGSTSQSGQYGGSANTSRYYVIIGITIVTFFIYIFYKK